jgi:hypothetical protein
MRFKPCHSANDASLRLSRRTKMADYDTEEAGDCGNTRKTSDWSVGSCNRGAEELIKVRSKTDGGAKKSNSYILTVLHLLYT